VIAGVMTYLTLLALGVPFPGVVAVFVGFTDLIPLIGATLGAVAGVAVAALHSPVDGLIVLAFFIALGVPRERYCSVKTVVPHATGPATELLQ
jgi:predicted PurR-regulated permease PerM